MEMFNILPSAKLKKLASIVGSDFYIVGGFVRNSLLGRECEDEDVCSPFTVDQLEAKLKDSEFIIKNKNKFFGTCKIVCDSKSFDYATFRTEIYKKGHCPETVEFITSLEDDSKRRDFTINSIYFDVLNGEIIDPFNGIGDIKKKKIRAIGQDTLKNDGLRILRMIRLAGEYKFSIEKYTFCSALKNIENLKDLSKSKVAEEIQKLFERTSNKGAVRAIRLYNKLGVWKYIGLDIERLKASMLAKCEDKFMGFIIDIIDNIKPASVSYFLNHLLDDCGFTKKRMAQIINILSGYYDALNHLKNKQYFFKYFDNFPQIYQILNKKSKFLAQKYKFFYRYIISHKLVIKKSDLKITEKDLKKHFPSMPDKLYDNVLMDVFSDVFDGKCKNSLQDILKNIAKKHFHKF